MAPTVIKEELKNMDPMDLEHNFDVIPPTPLKHGGLYILIPLLLRLDLNLTCFEMSYKNITAIFFDYTSVQESTLFPSICNKF